jgi:hypothetical protein
MHLLCACFGGFEASGWAEYNVGPRGVGGAEEDDCRISMEIGLLSGHSIFVGSECRSSQCFLKGEGDTEEESSHTTSTATVQAGRWLVNYYVIRSLAPPSDGGEDLTFTVLF